MRRRIFGNNNARYIIALLVIIVAFLLLGGGKWITGAMHGGGWMASFNWIQILISLVLGFLLGLVVAKRRRKWL
jgi:ABC-type antimicrobial peptide transport system permease subunit